MLQLIYSHISETCAILIFFFMGLERCITAWKNKDED